MDFTQELTLDLNAGIAYTTIAVKQGDSARWLKIHLTKNNVPYPLDASHNFMFRLRKPDGHGIINPVIVELVSNDTYVPIEVTTENFDNRMEYYHKEDNNYAKKLPEYFFEQVPEEIYDSSYYHKNDDGTFIPVVPGQLPPYYEFVTRSDIYYLLGNINYEESTVNVQLTEQVLAVAGRGYADIVEYDNIGGTLSTASFIINIIAQPNVAGNATSTDEFQKLENVVAEADDILGEAETWARGTNKNNEITEPSYLKDDNVTNNNFDHKKNSLYIQADDSFVPVGDAATYNSNLTYYYKDAYNQNNAKYYSEEALNAWSSLFNLTVSANALEAGSSPSVTKDSTGGAWSFIFGIPAGATGETGPMGLSNCVVSSDAPTDSNVVIWLKTGAEMPDYIGNANQILYDSNVDYSIHTIGYAIGGVNRAEASAVEAMQSAEIAQILSNEAKASAEWAYNNVQGAYASVLVEENARKARDNELQIAIDSKIINPVMPNDFEQALLKATRSDDIVEYSWSWPLKFDDLALEGRPRINDEYLKSTTNLSLIEKNKGQVGVADLDDAVMNIHSLAESAVQILQVNNSLLTPSAYVPPYTIDSSVTDSNWTEKRSTLYVYDAETGKYEHVESSATYNSQTYYYTYDKTYEGEQYINIGHVLTEENIVNKNYLDNPWFTVNQHKFETTTASSENVGEYLCDRWKILVCQGQSRSISLSNSGLEIGQGEPETDALDDFAIGQVLDKNLGTSLIGKTVCLSVGYYENTSIRYASGYAICSNNGTPFFQIKNGASWFVRLTKDGDNLVFQIACGKNLTGAQLNDLPITIKNVKLEIGEYSTLAQDVAPAYLEELSKCQKYFYRCEGQAYSSTIDNVTIVGRGIASLQKQLDWTLELPYVSTSSNIEISVSTDLIARKGITIPSAAGNLTLDAITNSTKFNGANSVYLQTISGTNMTQFASYYVLLPMAEESGEINYITISNEL